MRIASISPVQRTVVLVVVLVTGCAESSERTYPVRGIVRFPDGKVLREGSIEFEISGREEPIVARSLIHPDGSFTLGTYELADGALSGKHRVVVISDYVIGNGAERPGLIPEAVLNPKHRDYRTSGLVQEVQAKANNLLVEVEYANSADTPQPEPESPAPSGQ